MPDPNLPPLVSRTVMFCATPRTGSTLMHNDLLGLMDHWGPFDAEILLSRILRDGTALTWPELWAEIREICLVGSVIPLKVMFEHVPYISQFMRGEPLPERRPILDFSPANFDAFFAVFAESIWVRVRRGDPAAQAVSIYLAEQTGQWHGFVNNMDQPDPVVSAPAYNQKKLLNMLTRFIRHRRQWERFFEHYGINALTLDYDDAVNNYPAYLDELVATLGVRPVDPAPPRRFYKLGGALNAEFIARLREDASSIFSPEDLL